VSGRICTGKKSFCDRLGEIFSGVAEIIEEYRPAEAAVEEVFMARNPNSALKLGQARGAAIAAIVNAGLPVSEYTPRLIKQAVVGSGGADKSQVGHMVRILLGINQPLNEDQGDALAVALCHAHLSETASRLSKGAGW
jgi:crossover junction endodeoxyribonuclease RuvC